MNSLVYIVPCILDVAEVQVRFAWLVEDRVDVRALINPGQLLVQRTIIEWIHVTQLLSVAAAEWCIVGSRLRVDWVAWWIATVVFSDGRRLSECGEHIVESSLDGLVRVMSVQNEGGHREGQIGGQNFPHDGIEEKIVTKVADWIEQMHEDDQQQTGSDHNVSVATQRPFRWRLLERDWRNEAPQLVHRRQLIERASID